jgi:hypothetical protein
MAAVTRPGPADARIPCPLCGGLIHPIAGRCKHCKGDLRALRSARPAAAATLPALNQPAPGPAPHANGHAHGPTNGHHAAAAPAPSPSPSPSPHAHPHPHPHAHPHPLPPQSLVQAMAAAAPIPLAIHHGPGDAVPILPPRPTGRFTAPAPRASWKSWPVIVIILAVIAIVTAIILMLFPPGGAKDEGTNNAVQPAPDRMDTNPAPATPRQPPSTTPDPWSRRGGTGGTGGTTPTTPPDDPDIDDPNVDDALTSRDPFSRRGGGLGSRSTNMLYSIVKHACTRLAACSATNAQTKQICDLYTRVPSVTPPSCPAAARCLRSIDEMSCDTMVDDPSSLLQLKDKFTDCTDALGC